VKYINGMVLALAIVCLAALGGRAEDKKPDAKKEVTVKGTFVCTKCELGETSDCGTAIKVKESDKDVIYYVVDKGKAEKYHAKFCTKPAKGSVTGVVSEKDKKKYITPAKDGVKIE
jgi:hypothetical protein